MLGYRSISLSSSFFLFATEPHNEPFSSIGCNINDYPNPNYSPYSNQSNVNTGANFITDPKYCSIPGNFLYNSSITGKY